MTKTTRAAGMATDLMDFIEVIFTGYRSVAEAETFKISELWEN
jgi:hypothetical protein